MIIILWVIPPEYPELKLLDNDVKCPGDFFSWTGNLEHNIWLLGEVCVQCDQMFVSVEDHSGFGLDQIVS